MKKVFFTMFLAFTFILGLNANPISQKSSSNVELASLDCLSLAQGYYNHLRSEGDSHRRASRRANVFFRECQQANQ